MTKILQKEPIKINCPHCKQESTDAWICQMNTVLGMRYAYLCSNCQKFLGISKNPITTTTQINGQISFA
jgi:DNA-directed RNA polymerase subunit RPC12/RpoP